MFLPRLNLIFIHIPKCAGRSVEHFFGLQYKSIKNWIGYNAARDRFLQHYTAEEMVTYLINRDKFNKCFKFAFVRNPWARMVSEYFWSQRHPIIQTKVDFKTFVETTDYHWYNNSNKMQHLLPQADFVLLDGKVCTNYLGRVENLDDDWAKICELLHLPHSPLGRNNTTTHRHYSYYYNNHLKDIVAKKYEIDIDMFKYTFEDEKCQ